MLHAQFAFCALSLSDQTASGKGHSRVRGFGAVLVLAVVNLGKLDTCSASVARMCRGAWPALRARVRVPLYSYLYYCMMCQARTSKENGVSGRRGASLQGLIFA